MVPEQPSLIDVVDFTVGLLNDIDALRLRYWLGWLWPQLPEAVEGVGLEPWRDGDQYVVLVSGEVLSPEEYRRCRRLVADVVGKMHRCPLAFVGYRNDHRPLDEGDLVVGLCDVAMRAINRYVEWGAKRRRWVVVRALRAMMTGFEQTTPYTDELAWRLRQAIARLALFRCVQAIPFVGALRDVTGIEYDGSLARAERMPQVWQAVLEHHGLQLPVVYQLLQAAALPCSVGRKWAKEIRCMRRYIDPLQAAVATLEVAQGLVTTLDPHSRLWVLERLQEVK